MRPLTTERPTDTEHRTWSGAWIAVAAAVIILLAVGGVAWLMSSGDDAPDVVDQSVVPTEATTLPPESSGGDALTAARAYYAAFAADDVPAMMALFASSTAPANHGVLQRQRSRRGLQRGTRTLDARAAGTNGDLEARIRHGIPRRVVRRGR